MGINSFIFFSVVLHFVTLILGYFAIQPLENKNGIMNSDENSSSRILSRQRRFMYGKYFRLNSVQLPQLPRCLPSEKACCMIKCVGGLFCARAPVPPQYCAAIQDGTAVAQGQLCKQVTMECPGCRDSLGFSCAQSPECAMAPIGNICPQFP